MFSQKTLDLSETFRYGSRMTSTLSRNLDRNGDDVRDWSGYIKHSWSRQTGTLVVLVDSNMQGVNTDDPETPVTLICDAHATTMGFRSISRATLFMPVPKSWCEECASPNKESR